jgi:hypothetical protein
MMPVAERDAVHHPTQALGIRIRFHLPSSGYRDRMNGSPAADPRDPAELTAARA